MASLHLTCQFCEKVFTKSYDLRRHQLQKKPCRKVSGTASPGTAQPVQSTKKFQCDLCGIQLSSSQAKSRHKKKNCKVENKSNDEHSAKLEKGKAGNSISISAPGAHHGGVNVNQQNVTNNFTTNITIHWNEGDKSSPDNLMSNFTLEDVVKILSETKELKAFCSWDAKKRLSSTSENYVLDALVRFVEEMHKDPKSRNIFMNPKAKNQVLVCIDDKDGKQHWESRPLSDAIKILFDDVSQGMWKPIEPLAGFTDKVPETIEGGAGCIRSKFKEAPDRFAKQGERPITSHLIRLGNEEPDAPVGPTPRARCAPEKKAAETSGEKKAVDAGEKKVGEKAESSSSQPMRPMFARPTRTPLLKTLDLSVPISVFRTFEGSEKVDNDFTLRAMKKIAIAYECTSSDALDLDLMSRICNKIFEVTYEEEPDLDDGQKKLARAVVKKFESDKQNPQKLADSLPV